MKFTIHGFNQREAIKLGLTNDDLLFLRWFMDFKDSEDMQSKYIPEVKNMGYWCYYKKIANDLPILFSGTKSANNKKIQRMLNGNLSKVITRKFEPSKNKEGGKVYLVLIKKEYSKLIKENNNTEKEGKKVWTDLSRGSGQICPEGMDKSVQSDISISDISINNNIYPSIYSNNNNNIGEEINNDSEKKEEKEEVTYCNLEKKEVVEEKVNAIMDYTVGAYNKYQCMEFLNKAKGDVEFVNYCYDKALNRMKNDNVEPIIKLEEYILGTIAKEIKKFKNKN